MSEQQTTEQLANLYDWWELFWPVNVTWGELRGAANDDWS